ncbi:MAG: HlyD family efflux transporter periplasmic adaptor subunit [Defluviitaleaceae bacterium]|nr:HlyD family efflux transporter periplasmic adaptor subunit [Defluviitaleaceae bacterium]
MTKYKITALFVLISIIGLTLTGCDSNTPSYNAPPPVLAPEASQAHNSIIVRGIVESTESRNIYSTLGFTVDRIYVEAGDQVTQGQVLAVLDYADLELTVSQQRAALEMARQNSQNNLQETQRMLAEATTNLSNNTNMHIISAQASLSAAAANLEAAQQNYQNARRDYQEAINPQVLAAESFLRTARLEFERIETNHNNLTALYAGGIVSSDEMRQSENTLTHARNQYNDARISHDNAVQSQQRNLEQLRIAHQSAATAHRNAQDLLAASRIAAQQDIERLRGSVTSAEVGANLEHMEIALQLLERQLEDSQITAPLDGAVTAVIAREGAAGMGLLFTVADTNNLRIITSFREYDLSRLAVGMEVTITSDATGSAEYTGIISRINPAATANSPIVEFEAEVLVTSEDTDLRIGMNARLEISLE